MYFFLIIKQNERMNEKGKGHVYDLIRLNF
jgi:hypothetical protein